MNKLTVSDTDTKLCARCGVVKTRAEMRASSASKDGMYSYCKDCHNKQSREYKRTNREKVSELVRQYRAKMRKNELPRLREIEKRDRERMREKGYFQEYYLKNKPLERAKRKAYYTANKNKWRKYAATYRISNPEKIAENNHRRRAGRKTGEHYTKDEWIKLCNAYSNRCLCCGQQTKLTVDHIVPICKGGSNRIDNIQPLCYPCNKRKWKQIIDYRY